MNSGITVQAQGLAALLAEMRSLPEKVQRRALTGAVATGARVIKDEVVRRAPIYVEFNLDTGRYAPKASHVPPPGTLKRAIYSARAVNRCTATTEVFRVGVRSGKRTATGKTNKHDAYYARWVEYGHFTRTPTSIPGTRAQRREIARKKGLVRWVPPRPFFRPAFLAKKEEALKAVERVLMERLTVLVAGQRYLKTYRTLRKAA
jgi:HK97 gp10 family phage protein